MELQDIYIMRQTRATTYVNLVFETREIQRKLDLDRHYFSKKGMIDVLKVVLPSSIREFVRFLNMKDLKDFKTNLKKV